MAELPHLLDGSAIELLVPYRTRRFSLDSLSPNISIRATFGGPGVQWNDYTPVQLSRVPELIGPSGPLAVDVAVVRLSPADRNGRHNVGPSASLTSDLVQQESHRDRRNRPGPPDHERRHDGPRTRRHAAGRRWPSRSNCLATNNGNATEPETRLGQHVANLVPDGSYVEIGVGSTTENIADVLQLTHGSTAHRRSRHANHQQPAGSGCSRRPVANPRRRSYGDCCPSCGSLNAIRSCLFKSTRHVHNSRVLGSYPNFTAINGACSQSIYLERWHAKALALRHAVDWAGLAEFLIAGRLSPGGINVVALTSTAVGTSRIVHRLPTELVSIPTFLTDYVVTEWGIADLRGATRPECRDRIACDRTSPPSRRT